MCLLSNTQSKKKESYITLDVEMADYYRIKNEGKKVISTADEELIKQRAVEEYLKQQAAEQAAKQAEAPPEQDDQPKE